MQTHGVVPSMSRLGNPYDNAFCESFIKTLKQEEIYCHQYRDFDELSAHIDEFMDNYYNRRRLHSALGYQTPEEFEQAAATTATRAAMMTYFKPRRGKSDSEQTA
jgi:putative transposase